MKKVSFHTLGCKLNFSETSTLARQFGEGGFTRSASHREADICVVNSCTVTAESDKKTRYLIRRIHRENPDAIIAVTGCYAQLKAAEIADIPGVDIVVGNGQKGDLFRLVADMAGKGRAAIHCCESGELTGFFSAFSGGDRTRAFLKVQDGCDYRCSYCAIPDARGPSRNISVAQVVAEAQTIAAGGQREIVITGINTGDFGRTTGESFIDLLRALDEVEGIDRYRISSIEPNLLSDQVIDFTARSAKFQPHFHIPLQSGSDRILKLMRRRYTTSVFADRIEAVRRAMPDAFIGIDLITAFPGETDADFDDTYAFLKSIAPSYLHIFPYSSREGTPAATFEGHVDPRTAESRAKKLGELNREISRIFYDRFVGSEAEILLESSDRKGMMSGFTGNYIKVELPYDRSLVNKLVRVRMSGVQEDGVMAATLI